MKRILIISILLVQLHSCKEYKIENSTDNDSAVSIPENINSNKKNDVSESIRKIILDTIRIDKNKHREILNLLTVIPDNSRGSWEWKMDNRLQMVNEALNDGYIIDSDPQYMNILAIEPNYFQIQVVDGNWIMALFKINENNKIVITDDVVGDGDDLHAYEINDSEITELKIKDIIPDIKPILIKYSDKFNCDSLLEPVFELTLDYDFTQKDKLVIHSPYKHKSENSECLNGNTLELHFDKRSRRFQVGTIEWKATELE